VRFDYYSGR